MAWLRCCAKRPSTEDEVRIVITPNNSSSRSSVTARRSTVLPISSNVSSVIRAQVEEQALSRSQQKSPRRGSISRRPSVEESEQQPPVKSSSVIKKEPEKSGSFFRKKSGSSKQEENYVSSPEATKIILLGAGESGKSTFSKQMKVLHAGGFTEEERLHYKPDILKNTVDSMRQVLQSMQNLGIKFGGTAERQSTSNVHYTKSRKLFTFVFWIALFFFFFF